MSPVDAEAALVAILPPPASTTVPNPRPEFFTRVSRAGGAPRNIAQSEVRLIVECWGPDSVSAFDRARQAWATIWAAQHSWLTPDVWTSRVEMTEPVNLPDDETGLPRYQFTAQITASGRGQ